MPFWDEIEVVGTARRVLGEDNINHVVENCLKQAKVPLVYVEHLWQMGTFPDLDGNTRFALSKEILDASKVHPFTRWVVYLHNGGHIEVQMTAYEAVAMLYEDHEQRDIASIVSLEEYLAQQEQEEE